MAPMDLFDAVLPQISWFVKNKVSVKYSKVNNQNGTMYATKSKMNDTTDMRHGMRN